MLNITNAMSYNDMVEGITSGVVEAGECFETLNKRLGKAKKDSFKFRKITLQIAQVKAFIKTGNPEVFNVTETFSKAKLPVKETPKVEKVTKSPKAKKQTKSPKVNKPKTLTKEQAKIVATLPQQFRAEVAAQMIAGN